MPLEAKVLGQNINYPTDYCPLILVPVPRRLNREKYDINDPEALFRGYDTKASPCAACSKSYILRIARTSWKANP